MATGQVTYPIYGEIRGHVKSLMVFFRPVGMYNLFGVDMGLLSNRAMDLRSFLGIERCEELIEDLLRSQVAEDQIRVLDAFFLALEPIAKSSNDLEEVLEFIHKRRGIITIKQLERICHCHRKTLERHFKKKIGLSPKVYAQIYQFKNLINLLQEHPDITWSQLSDRAGYYDQSHMSRYVKEYLNVSPNNIVKVDMDFINYLLRN